MSASVETTAAELRGLPRAEGTGPMSAPEHTPGLIAAAPEMYEALKKIAYEPFGAAEATAQQVLDAVTDLARAAIAKAEGVES